MSKRPSAAPLGASLVVLSTMFYASYGIWTKLMGHFFGGYTASGLRAILVLLILVPVAAAYGQLEKVRFKKNWHYLLGMTLSSTLVWGPLYFAILKAGVALSIALNYAGIVMGMFLFGWMLANERLTRGKWFSALLGLAGLWMVFAPSEHITGWLPLFAAFGSGVAGAFNMVLAKKIPYNATQSTLAIWFTVFVANIPMALLLGEHRPAVGWHVQWAYLVCFALASIAASWTFIKGIKLIDASAAGVIGLLEIVFGVLFGAVFFGERPDRIALLGAAVIIVAAAIPYLKDYETKRIALKHAK